MKFKQINRHLKRVFVLAVLVFFLTVSSQGLFEKFYKDYFFSSNPQHFEFIIGATLGSFFPISAVAYLLFQHDTQRRKLARGFWLLGIDVKGDLEQKDLELIKNNSQARHLGDEDWNPDDWDVEAYGEYFKIVNERSNVKWNYVVQSIPPILTTILGLCLFTNQEQINTLLSLEASGSNVTLKAIQFGFLGSYIFSVQLVYRRYTTLDLQPSVYMYCALTMISGIAFNFVAFEAINALNNSQGTQTATGLAGGIIAIVAFSLGYFPYLAISWFNHVGYTALGIQKRRSDALPLSLIDGISQFHETRLRDEGIDNVQNLASISIDELLINTRFSAAEIISWVDQAILYLYIDPNEIEIFRRGGVRCFTDLRDYWGPYFKAYHTVGSSKQKLIETIRHSASFSKLNTKEKFIKYSSELSDNLLSFFDYEQKLNEDKDKDNNFLKQLYEQRKELALNLKTTPDYLDALYLATKSGPNLSYIRHYWNNLENIANINQEKKSVRWEKHKKDIKKEGHKERIYQKKDLLETDRDRDSLLSLLVSYGKSLEDDEWKGWQLENDTPKDQMYFHLGMASRIHDYGDWLKPDLEEKAYLKAIEIAPDFSKPYNALAWFYYQQKYNLQKAKNLATKAVELATKQVNGKDIITTFQTLISSALDTKIRIEILLAEQETDPEKKKNLLNNVTQILVKIEEIMAKFNEQDKQDLLKEDNISYYLDFLDTLVYTKVSLAQEKTNQQEKEKLLNDAESKLQEGEIIIKNIPNKGEQNWLENNIFNVDKHRKNIKEQRRSSGI